MLLNSTPNTEGHIPESDKLRYRELGEAIEHNFGHPLAVVTNVTACEAELDFDSVEQINCTDLWEDYRLGHRIRSYLVEGRINGTWSKLAQGTAVGRRKLDLFDKVTVDRVRVRITQSVDTPIIRRFQVHKIDDTLLQPTNQVHIVSQWRKAGVWQGGTEVLADLSDVITRADQYEVRFLTTASKPVIVESAVLLFEGKAADPAFLSCVGTDMLIINRTQAIGEGASTAIRATLRASAGSNGKIQIRLRN
jgi:alpha-L-fucosidase